MKHVSHNFAFTRDLCILCVHLAYCLKKEHSTCSKCDYRNPLRDCKLHAEVWAIRRHCIIDNIDDEGCGDFESL